MDDLAERLHEVERISRENAVAIERAAADARNARDAVADFRPIILARSGDEQRRDKFELNVNQAHDKLRAHGTRLAGLERWKDRARWTGLIIMFLGGALAWIVDKVIALQKWGGTMGAEPRKLTDAAIDSAIHGLPEPQNGWRNHIPPEDLGAMKDAGSGQITLQACVAALHYGNRLQAIRTLENYAALCPTRFMLSEPWSLIYGKAIVCNWLAVILIADRIGERALARKFRGLVETWAGTCALMESHGKVMAAGCRCWGHEVNGGGWDDLWAFACRRDNPPAPSSRKYGTPGASDDWGWLNRCAALAIGELRAAAAPFLGRDWRSLLAGIPRWGARTEMQLLGWADGSRLWLMGDDEADFDDEDENGNTPGWLAAGVLGGRIVALPKWPNPIDGRTRLRQTGCRADLDGSPQFGWSLLHSHLGERKVAGGYLTRLEPYTASPLIFWQHCQAGSLSWVDRLASEPTGPIPIPPVSPVPSPTPKPPKRRKPWWRFW